MSSSRKEFEEWLAGRLRDLSVDEAAFGPYIQGILEDVDYEEDQEVILGGFLEELMGETAKPFIVEILSKWRAMISASLTQPQTSSSTPAQKSSELGAVSESENLRSVSVTQSEVDTQLDNILRNASISIEEQASSRSVGKGSSASSQVLGQPDSQLRAKILSNVNDSDSDSEEEPGTSSKKKSSDSSIPTDVGRHANVSKVLNEQKEMRDRAKGDAAKKKERDKEDRAKQKAAVQDRKEKAKKKATKVERKR